MSCPGTKPRQPASPCLVDGRLDDEPGTRRRRTRRRVGGRVEARRSRGQGVARTLQSRRGSMLPTGRQPPGGRCGRQPPPCAHCKRTSVPADAASVELLGLSLSVGSTVGTSDGASGSTGASVSGSEGGRVSTGCIRNARCGAGMDIRTPASYAGTPTPSAAFKAKRRRIMPRASRSDHTPAAAGWRKGAMWASSLRAEAWVGSWREKAWVRA